ncbi:MAG: DeoR/GlpR family DNA-binding transcription regulator [Christensenellaceae bacterium]
MKSVSVSKRRKKILDLLFDVNEMHISSLTNFFNVSDETIRKDLMELEKDGYVRREHGGVVLISKNDEEPIIKREFDFSKQKEDIAKAALTFLNETNSDVIAIDAGSSTYLLAKLLAEHKGYTIVTNSLLIAGAFDKNNDVIVLGGQMRCKDMSLYGKITIDNIKDMTVSTSFIGTSGVANRNGVCAVSFDTAEYKKVLIKNSGTVVVLCDSSKFVKNSLTEVVDWSQVDVVITDSGISEDDANKIREKTQLCIV